MAHLRKKKGSPYWFACWKDGRRSVNRSTKETNKNKAAIKMARWAAEVEKSFHKNIGKIYFGELANRWLESQERDLKPHTFASYREALARVLPIFESRVVRDIRPEHIERFKTELGKNVSARSVNYSLWILRAILDYAVKLGYSHTNAGKLVRGLKQRHAERKPFSLENLHKIFDKAEGQWKVLFMFSALTTCRLGECLAVKWENLDREKGTIVIRESFGQYGLGTPKNISSHRTINLPLALIDKLVEHKIQQNEQRLRSGGEWQNNGLIFSAQNGNYLDPRNVRTAFYRTVKNAGLPPMRFHDLRGIAATLLLESGATPKEVMNQGGWRTAAFVLEVYANVSQESAKQAQENLQKYVFG